jgi:undecaprenyl-diphosphatase
VNTLIVLVAQYLLFGLVLLAGLTWLTLDGAGKLRMAADGVLASAVLCLGIWIAGRCTSIRAVVSGPVDDAVVRAPGTTRLFPPTAAAGGLLTAVVLRYHRALGVLVGVGAVLVAAARVAATLHHLQDVVAGLALGCSRAPSACC